jgi:glucan phosphoethanolaminetransferase (alkaline phosphatase superfamily)
MSENPTKGVLQWVIGSSAIALVLLIMVIIFGNLSGNVGFTNVSSPNYINAQSVIGNATDMATNTAAQLPTVGTIIGVGLLILVLVSLLVFAIVKFTKLGSGGNGSGASFG